MIVLDTNVKAKSATTQYSKFDYNSMVRVGENFLCASDDGLFKLQGDSDNGSKIKSYFEIASIDFGISNIKKLRCIYLSYEAASTLTLTVSTELGLSEPILVPAAVTGQNAKKIPVSRSTMGRYWTFRIESDDDFSIDEIQVLPIIIGHGREKN